MASRAAFPGVVQQTIQEQLDAPCWHNWTHSPRIFADARSVPVIWSHRFKDPDNGWRETNVNLALVRDLAAAHPDRTWLLWNEPDLTGQADTSPDVAVQHTRKWVEALGGNGRWACCGTVHLGPACHIPGTGLRWLDGYLRNGGDVPDVWHFHIYCVRTIEEWQYALDEFWAWWSFNGAGRPVIISETSAGTFDQANYDLIWHIASIKDPKILSVHWFSAYNAGDPGWRSQLVDRDTLTLNKLGWAYVEATQPWSGYGHYMPR